MSKIINYQLSIINKASVLKLKISKLIGKWKMPSRQSLALEALAGGENGNYLSNKRGFTLIELMIVIAILSGLAVMFISSFPASQKRGRDTKRKSDMRQYQTAAELYANKSASGIYPVSGVADPSTLCATLGLTTCPQDPKNGTSICTSGACQYRYVSSATGSSYGLWARLESPAAVANPYFIVCSSGITKEGNTQPTAANTCP